MYRAPRAAACSIVTALLAVSLAAGGCSPSSHATDLLLGPLRGGARPGTAAGIQHTNSGEYVPTLPCPTLVASTPDAPIRYVPSSGIVASFRAGNRFRIETTGQMAGPSLEDMGPCAATDTPSIRFLGGHANVFVHGTDISITVTGQPLEFGALQFPGAGLEQGLVLTTDAQNNVMEILWPRLAGIGAGGSIVRVQLARWNGMLVSSAQTYDIVWDITAEENGIQMCFRGHADNLGINGLAVPQEGANAPPVCPSSLAGTDDAVSTVFAAVAQFRINRLRLEVTGDTPTGVLNATGPCATADPAGVNFLGATANVFRAGTRISVTGTGQPLAFGPLLVPVTLERGIVLATDASGNMFEIIWPGLAGLPPGPPVLRLQLATYSSWVRTGQKVDVTVTFSATGPDGVPATYTATAINVDIPSLK